MFDWLELPLYFFGFWLFLFNPKFRAEILRKWKESGIARRFLIIVEAASYVFCGVVIPFYLLWWLLQ